MGSRQVVRHVALDHAFGGSNPPSPAMSAYSGRDGAGCHAALSSPLSAGLEADQPLIPHQVPWKVP